MAFVIADRVKETSTTAGADTRTLGAGDFGGYQTFNQGIGDGNSTYYAIENNLKWEVGIGTYSSSLNTLSRDTVLASSDGGSKVSLNGVSLVLSTSPASKSVLLNKDDCITSFSPLYLGVQYPDGTVQTTAPQPSGYLAEPPNGRTPLTLTRTSAGSLLDAYIDNSYDRTVSLHINNSPASNPTWKLGMKDSPSSYSEAPSYGYTYGKNGSAGMQATTSTGFVIHDANGFWVRHLNVDALNVSSSTTQPTVSVKSAVLQSSNLQEWQGHDGVSLLSVNTKGALVFNKKISDNDAPNSSLFYSSTQNKLVFKDSAGDINALYS